MAIRTKTALATQISTLLADNVSGDISEADLRSVVTDIIDSLVFALVEADIIPNADGTHDLGSSAARFAQGYVDELHVTNGLVITEAADHPIVPAAGLAQIWIGNGVTQTVQVTFDDGSDVELLHSGSGDDLTTTTAVVGADIVPTFDASASNAPIGRTWTNIIADLGIQVEPSEGAFANGDKTKLDGIEAGATADQTAAEIAAMSQDWRGAGAETLIQATTALEAAAAAGVADGDKGDITVSVSGTVWIIDDEAVTLPKMAHIATSSILGRVTAATGDVEVLTAPQVRTLLNVEDGATADQTGAEIKVAYEAEADTNAFTDALLSKLNGIEALADVTDATNVAAAGAVMDGDFSANGFMRRTGAGTYDTDAEVLMADTSDVLTAGFAAAVDDGGAQTTGTYTPDYTTGNYKQITNGGAFTLAPPSPANDNAISITLMIINNASAGAITTTGFSHVAGDSFTTVNTNRFLCQIDVYDDGGTEFSTLQVLALQ